MAKAERYTSENLPLVDEDGRVRVACSVLQAFPRVGARLGRVRMAVHAGVVSAPLGSVLAVFVLGGTQRGYWGGGSDDCSRVGAVTGPIIDSRGRDVDAIERRRFSVFAEGRRRAARPKPGRALLVNRSCSPVAEVRPGDWLVGDADGLVVVPREQLDECLQAATQRAAKGVDNVQAA